MVLEVNAEDITAYLSAIAELSTKGRKPEGRKYSSLAELVLKEGELLDKTPFTKEEEDWLLYLFDSWYGRRPVPMKSCYETATRLSLDAAFATEDKDMKGGSVEYGEGYGIDGNLGIPIPIEHAVFVLNGKPVDIVWRADHLKGSKTRSPRGLLKRAKQCQQDNQYYMIRFPVEYMEKVILGKGTYGVIEFNRELLEKGKEACL